MAVMSRFERPLIYGISGRSRWLMDASLVIWNVVGVVALVALVRWLQGQEPIQGPGFVAKLGARLGAMRQGRQAQTIPVHHHAEPDVSGKAQMAHAREVIGDLTSEDILAQELERTQSHSGPGKGQGGTTESAGKGKKS